jgi:amino acid transporter
VNLNEETHHSDSAPGVAALVSTVILLVTYVSVTVAIVAYAGVDRVVEYEDDTALFGAIADQALGTELSWIVVLAIITSAIASTQTTILPASRTSLSMARQNAFPEALGRVHPRYMTPHVSTIVIGVTAAIWYGVLNTTSQNFLFDSLTALSLMIAFYYALTGLACAIYYRHELTKSVKNFFFIGVGPVVGSLILAYLFYKAIVEYAKVGDSYSGTQAFGIAIPVVLGLGLLLLGVVLMLLWRVAGDHKNFFGRKLETVDPAVAAGHRAGVAAVPEDQIA